VVRQYYVPAVTDLSEQELESVLAVVEPPVCLLGGWAVHVHVNAGFEREHGREYIGSRDIDVGVHVDPDWEPGDLPAKPVGNSIRQIEALGYTESRFGFVQHFHRESHERISEAEAGQYGMHDLFQVYVDVIPDTTQLDAFREAFGFEPPAEPLLAQAFDGEGESLSDHVSWSPPAEALIVSADLLGAMKVRSLPDRDKSHKRVKDLADPHALLWYVREFDEMRSAVLDHVSDGELERVEETIDQDVFGETAELLQVDPAVVSGSVRRLVR